MSEAQIGTRGLPPAHLTVVEEIVAAVHLTPATEEPGIAADVVRHLHDLGWTPEGGDAA